jgi:hypothetical protein
MYFRLFIDSICKHSFLKSGKDGRDLWREPEQILEEAQKATLNLLP